MLQLHKINENKEDKNERDEKEWMKMTRGQDKKDALKLPTQGSCWRLPRCQGMSPLTGIIPQMTWQNRADASESIRITSTLSWFWISFVRRSLIKRLASALVACLSPSSSGKDGEFTLKFATPFSSLSLSWLCLTSAKISDDGRGHL